ncbi:hypothetical protein FACS189442_5640 [Spirochaetia bacterium]|nr:hypothetical protein FACS189442_5640 [Spirochaetia bacterium]
MTLEGFKYTLRICAKAQKNTQSACAIQHERFFDFSLIKKTEKVYGKTG